MDIQEYIQDSLPVFDVIDDLSGVISFFEETSFSHVAVTERNEFIGVLSSNDLPCFEPDKKIEDFRFQLETFFVHPQTLWLDVLERFTKNEANVLPVLDSTSHKVMGYYEIQDIVDFFISTPFFTEPGGILVVSKGIKDYSLSEISQIVEGNNGKLLGAFITNNENDLVQVTLKINTGNLNEVIQTFRRYSYTIVFGNNDDQFLKDLKERSAYLDKYLNV